ncbi:MAG: hypothetical protein WDW38_008928 [Sanguina aurantia]
MKLHVSAHLTPRTTRPAPPLAAAAAVHSFKCSLAQLTRHIKPTRQPLAPLRAVNVDPVPSIQIDGEDFYALLRCSPASTKSEIKSAWISRMREFHPDHAVASSVDDANVLCSLLNEIYETLSDPSKRALYDALAGFGQGVNPFLDTAFPADQIFVDEVTCIGCGLCCRGASNTFAIEDSLWGRARVITQGADTEEVIQIAQEMCPVDCIHNVTLPQLSLLETALSSMPRIEVFVMRRQSRSPGDVFEEASRAWEKRQAAIAARMAPAPPQQQRSTTGWSFWGTGMGSTESRDTAGSSSSSSKSGGSSSSGSGSGSSAGPGAGVDPDAKRIAALAASAARSARLWRMYSSNRRALGSLDSADG